jgi:hypothetical protein
MNCCMMNSCTDWGAEKSGLGDNKRLRRNHERTQEEDRTTHHHSYGLCFVIRLAYDIMIDGSVVSYELWVATVESRSFVLE